jgi:hypothetical protein
MRTPDPEASRPETVTAAQLYLSRAGGGGTVH